MRTVYKYGLPEVRSRCMMPRGAEVLFVGTQRYGTFLWAAVDLDAPVETREFVVVGTGHPIPTDATHYIGTTMDGAFVWHVFEVI